MSIRTRKPAHALVPRICGALEQYDACMYSMYISDLLSGYYYCNWHMQRGRRVIDEEMIAYLCR